MTLRDRGESFYSAGDDASSPHTLQRRLLPGFAALALVGLVLAGCGGSSKAGGSAGAAGTDGRAAQAFPATTAAFVDANIDDQSAAWKRLLALGARFPSFPKLVAAFDRSANEATGNGPTLSQVRAWLGSEVAVGVLDVPAAGDDPGVSRLRRGARSRRPGGGAREAEGHDLARHARCLRPLPVDHGLRRDRDLGRHRVDRQHPGDRRRSHRAPRRQRRKLADTSDFKDTLATLPSDNIAVAYAPERCCRSSWRLPSSRTRPRTRSRSRARR